MNSPAKSVLVVDDTPENIDILKGILSPYFTVKVASNGRMALKAVAKGTPPDLILLDVMMPDMDGYEVCRLLKADPQTRQVPVIFVTAKSSVEDETHGFSLGAADYIVKPVSPPVVLARVRTHLALADRSRHLEDLVQERTEKLQRRTQELEETRLEIIRRLGRAGEFRDYETGLHVFRLSHYAKTLSKHIGYTDFEAEELMYAAMLHDIGKIGLPDSILLKPDRLTPEERDVVKTHCEIGAEIIGDHPCGILQLARTVALTHHERWDGTGYPHALKGEEIPLPGRITALVDVFDALTSERPYKLAWDFDEAMDYIRDEAGHSLDPSLVERFLAVRDEVREVMLAFTDAVH
ncbi:two-component system response regulator [Azospira sp. I13]|uniref:HD domain-containing phosphohydrolase n=1 Tax=Azospira sp. I13 TaxID=1765050 RepID=UPI000D4EBEC7|nr:HD domain-containing phosphohydrolase [Azospira sp. I13]GBG00796.1 two-component system response regulator [Azospira sp. I13]